MDLSQKPEVYGLIQKHVEKVNLSLPREGRVVRFALLHKEFDADEGDLTRSRKLRRFSIEDRYGKLIEAAYSGEDEAMTEAEVKYRDGRTGKITTAIKIVTLAEGLPT